MNSPLREVLILALVGLIIAFLGYPSYGVAVFLVGVLVILVLGLGRGSPRI